jgi:hypothetical protein
MSRGGAGQQPSAPRSRRPFRDSAILYGALAVIVVIVAAVTGGDVLRAIVVAALVWAAAMAWTWWRLRTRAQRESQP